MRLFTAAALFATSAFIATPALAQQERQPFTGFYVGGSIGYTAQPSNAGETIVFDRDLNGSFGDTVTTAAGANAFSPGFCNGAANNGLAASGCDTDRDGIEYSGRIGFDAHIGSFVAGVVGEFGHTDATSSVSGFSTTPASYTITREMDYNANLRLRLGVTPGQTTLLYVTGGGAYAKLNNSFTTTNAANSFTPTSGESDTWGFTAGGGIEQMVSRNISFGLEYLYTRLKDDDYGVRVGAGTAPATNPFLLAGAGGTNLARSNDEFELHSVRAVLNFRF